MCTINQNGKGEIETRPLFPEIGTSRMVENRGFNSFQKGVELIENKFHPLPPWQRLEEPCWTSNEYLEISDDNDDTSMIHDVDKNQKK